MLHQQLTNNAAGSGWKLLIKPVIMQRGQGGARSGGDGKCDTAQQQQTGIPDTWLMAVTKDFGRLKQQKYRNDPGQKTK